jgi:hypothetical protein
MAPPPPPPAADAEEPFVPEAPAAVKPDDDEPDTRWFR